MNCQFFQMHYCTLSTLPDKNSVIKRWQDGHLINNKWQINQSKSRKWYCNRQNELHKESSPPKSNMSQAAPLKSVHMLLLSVALIDTLPYPLPNAGRCHRLIPIQRRTMVYSKNDRALTVKSQLNSTSQPFLHSIPVRNRIHQP